MASKPSRRSDQVDTLLGPQTQITGDVKFKGGLCVQGLITGNVLATDDPNAVLSITDSGKVIGEVRVPHVDLNGTVEGDVYASERLELDGASRVKGNVFYKTIQMNAGAQVNGKMVHKADGKPVLAIGEEAPAKTPVK